MTVQQSYEELVASYAAQLRTLFQMPAPQVNAYYESVRRRQHGGEERRACSAAVQSRSESQTLMLTLLRWPGLSALPLAPVCCLCL